MRTLIVSLFLSIACFSQQQDSLLYQLLNIPNDTERVNQLYQAGFNLRNSDPQLSYQFAHYCYKEALKCKSIRHLAKSYNLSGVLSYKQANYTNALNYQKKALALNEKISNLQGIAVNQTNLGNIYGALNYFELSEIAYLKALQIYNQLNDKPLIAKALMNIGVLKYEHGELDAAVRQFKEALNFANALNAYDLMASCNNNIGTIYREQNKLDSALAYLYEAIKQRELTDNELELADSYNNIANVFIKQINFQEAKHYLQLADSIAKEYNYLEAKVEIYDTWSNYYETQKQFEEALAWNKKYHALKDSLVLVNRLVTESNFEEQQPYFSPKKGPKNNLPKIVFISILSLLFIGIPIFLIRYKR